MSASEAEGCGFDPRRVHILKFFLLLMMCGQNRRRAGIYYLLLSAALTAFYPMGRLAAQTPSPTPETVASERAFWRAKMPAGHYIVDIAKVTSVSKHSYVVDGAVLVTDVTIGTEGSELARFYYLEPLTPQPANGVGQGTVNVLKDRAKEAADRVDGVAVWKQVVKNYPTTTHARTIEYRLETLESLNKLFYSIEDCFLQGKGGTFEP